MLKHSLLSLTALVGALNATLLVADTVELKNGSRFHGKISDQRSTQTLLALETEGGWITFARLQITRTEKDERTARPVAAVATSEGEIHPAFQREMVAVTLKKGQEYYGRGRILGARSDSSTADTLVLEVPGVGHVRIPQSAVEKTEAATLWSNAAPAPTGFPAAPEPRAAAFGPEGGKAKTAHLVTLKNGRKMRGTVVQSQPSEPLVLEVGGMGRVTVPRAQVVSVEESAGEITVEPASPKVPESADAVTPAPSQPETPATRTDVPQMSAELFAEISGHVHELQRWRARNRSRAENSLVAIGAAALPALHGIARDPLPLTRRAVQRIVRAISDPDGVPIAIDGLMDDDDFVRESAAEALKAMTGEDLGYRPHDAAEKRLEAVRRWTEWRTARN